MIENDVNEIVEPIFLSLQKKKLTDKFSLEKNPEILYADSSKLIFPLILRRWENGDYFYPIGMSGKKKISDYFSDNKFSLIDKENTWLLCSGKDIVWVVGHRMDERFKITDSSKELLIMRIG